MKRNGKYVVICMLAVIGLGIQAAELKTTLKLSLSDARSKAREHNYDIRSKSVDISVAREQIREAFRSGLPQVHSDVSFANNLELATQLIPNFFEGRPDELIEVAFGTKYSTGINVKLEQLIFSGTYWIALKSAKVFEQLAEENRELTELDALESVSATYYLALVTRENREILAASLENLNQTLAETRARYEEGFVEETDVDQLRISVARLENEIRAADRQLDIAEKLLNFQMGVNLDQELMLTTPMDELVTGILANASDRRFDLDRDATVKVARTNETISELNWRNEKFQYWPKLSGYLNYNWNAQRDSFNFLSDEEGWYRSINFGIKLEFPSFTSGMQKSRIRQAKLALKQSRIATRQVEESRKLAFIQTRTALDTAEDQYRTARDNLALSARVFDRTRIKYGEGMATSMDLIQAHDQYLSQKGNYIEALSTLLDAQNGMDRMVGSYSVVVEETEQ